MYVEFYEKILYPIQDKAIEAFKGSPFYLTGGTVLSRVYYQHRYSDALDFFVNYLSNFERLANAQIEKLSKIFKDVEVDYRGDYFCHLYVFERRLKIELVNDVPSHIGDLVNHPNFGLIDSKENILTNKITAVMDRSMPKDIVYMYFLIKDGVSLRKALVDVHSKAAGIVPVYIAKLLSEFDYSLLDTEIKWIKPIPSDEIRDFMTEVSMMIIRGDKNI